MDNGCNARWRDEVIGGEGKGRAGGALRRKKGGGAVGGRVRGQARWLGTEGVGCRDAPGGGQRTWPCLFGGRNSNKGRCENIWGARDKAESASPPHWPDRVNAFSGPSLHETLASIKGMKNVKWSGIDDSDNVTTWYL